MGGDSREGTDLANLARLAWDRGDTARARELWHQAPRIYEAIEDPNAECVRRLLADRSPAAKPACKTHLNRSEPGGLRFLSRDTPRPGGSAPGDFENRAHCWLDFSPGSPYTTPTQPTRPGTNVAPAANLAAPRSLPTRKLPQASPTNPPAPSHRLALID